MNLRPRSGAPWIAISCFQSTFHAVVQNVKTRPRFRSRAKTPSWRISACYEALSQQAGEHRHGEQHVEVGHAKAMPYSMPR